jgi:hypothetical protein
MSDLDNGAATAAPESEPVSQVTEAPAQAQEAPGPDLDAELNAIYDKANPPRGDDGKFASKDGEPVAEEATEETVSEGKPENEAVETAQPSIQPPNSLPSELKAVWASVPPAMQEHIAKREAETHKAITQLGQQAKSLQPFGQLVESNRDVFQNHRRNVDPVAGISQLLEAQRQLDRDPFASIAHIAKVYGVDLSMFGSQSGEASNQSPQVASLQAYIRDLEAKTSNLERLVMTREQREAEAQTVALQSTVEDFLKENPLDDEIVSDVVTQIEALKITSPHLSQKELMKQAYEKALWSNPQRRQALLAEEHAKAEAAKAKEQAKRAAEAKRAGTINVRGTPGSARPVRTLEDELGAIYDKSRSA